MLYLDCRIFEIRNVGIYMILPSKNVDNQSLFYQRVNNSRSAFLDLFGSFSHLKVSKQPREVHELSHLKGAP